MSGRFVRASKYRHVFGQTTRREQCYDNLRISKNAWDTNLVKANPKYLSVNWEASGGGAFAVIPLDERGKLPEQLPLFRGHTAPVLDTDWSPFDDAIVASGGDDGKVLLWKVPDGFTLYNDADEAEDVKPVGKLSGHSRKVGHVLFNPAADNILASSSGDYTVKLWDLADGQAKLTLKHNDIVQSLSWSANGSMLVTTSRDKKLRFWDVRQQKPAHEVPGHTGAKNSRVAWMGEHDRVVTTGFSKMSDRQLGLWDLRNPAKPVGGDFIFLDSISGVCMPFWDDSCQMLYLAGKGDGNIRYYEYEHDKFEPLSEHKSPEPQRGIAFLPKRGVNTHANEVMRAYKTVNDAYIEPIAFIVPRRSEMFQDDIYPPATAATPAVSSADWLAGKTALPPKLSMEDLFDGQEPKEIPAEDIPRPSTTRSAPEPAPASAPAPKADEPKPEPTPTPAPAATAVAAREMPTVNSNKQSMASIASKFGDADADDDEDDASSFEEIPKPIERPSVAAAAAARQEKSEPAASTTRSAPAPQPATQPSAESSSAQSPPAPASVTSRPAAEVNGRAEPSGGSNAPAAPAATAGSGVPARAGSAATAAGGLKEVLGEIKGLLEAQSRQIESLRQEVGELRAVVKGE